MMCLLTLALAITPLQQRGYTDLKVGAHVAGTIQNVADNGLLTIRRTADAPPHQTMKAQLYGVRWPKPGKESATLLTWLRQRCIDQPAQFIVRDRSKGIWWLSATMDDKTKPGADLDGYVIYIGLADTGKTEFPY